MLDAFYSIYEVWLAIEQNLTPGQTAAILWICSSAVQALPEPRPQSLRAYLFVYRFFHLLAGNLKLVNKQPKQQ